MRVKRVGGQTSMRVVMRVERPVWMRVSLVQFSCARSNDDENPCELRRFTQETCETLIEIFDLFSVDENARESMTVNESWRSSMHKS